MIPAICSVFRQAVGIPIATNCVHLIADLFSNSFEVDFMQVVVKESEKTQSRSFNFTFRYIDAISSHNDSQFDDYSYGNYTIEQK